MLSILIPTYNYNVVPLVLDLHKQCLECEINFEILVFDDGSKLFTIENHKINSLKNCKHHATEKYFELIRKKKVLFGIFALIY